MLFGRNQHDTVKQLSFNLKSKFKKKNLPATQKTQETRVQSLGREDPLEEEMTTHSSILTWKIPWREKPDWLQFTGSQRVWQDWATTHKHIIFLAMLSVEIGLLYH